MIYDNITFTLVIEFYSEFDDYIYFTLEYNSHRLSFFTLFENTISYGKFVCES